ncbi:MAG: hypothetical protein IPJ75_05025 [Ignavibacteriales bacterium]|nr:hypothetical protein [Ignavibacteriales bacterium]
MDLLKKYYAAITALFVFIIYFSTMAPSVLQIDTGELAAAQALPGIAHPTDTLCLRCWDGYFH